MMIFVVTWVIAGFQWLGAWARFPAPWVLAASFTGALTHAREGTGGGCMAPELSPIAWALLGLLHRSAQGGPAAPPGFEEEYAELRRDALVMRNALGEMQITEAGEAALRKRFEVD